MVHGMKRAHVSTIELIAISFYRIIKDKVYEAYVKEKEAAKKDYQEAVDRGESAGHIELRYEYNYAFRAIRHIRFEIDVPKIAIFRVCF